MRVHGQFECWDGDGKRKELGGYDGNEKGWSVVCVIWKGGQSEIVGGGCKLLRSGANEQEWNGVGIVGPTIQRTEGRPGQCEQEE